jgi:hypothetical protein
MCAHVTACVDTLVAARECKQVGTCVFVCCPQGLGETERNLLLNEAARWVVDHLFGSRSQRSKVGHADCESQNVDEQMWL